MRADALFTFPESLAPFRAAFADEGTPWSWVAAIVPALAGVVAGRGVHGPGAASILPGMIIRGDVYLGEGVKLAPHGVVEGPAWIGPGCELRPGVWIRGNVIAGRGCVLGNACEYKNCLLLDQVETPHYNYVGDSVLGTKAHLGAGVICSNLRLDRQPVSVRGPDGRRAPTGLRKLGLLAGDGAEVGCNSALQPGTILGRKSIVWPLTPFGGILPEGHQARPASVAWVVERRP